MRIPVVFTCAVIVLCCFCVFVPAQEYLGYALDGAMVQEDWGYSGQLIPLSAEGPFPPDAQLLKVQAFFQTEDILRVRIFDPNDKGRWTVPEVILQQQSPPTSPPTERNYEFSWTSSPFGFSVQRSDGEVLFNSTSPQSNSTSSPDDAVRDKAAQAHARAQASERRGDSLNDRRVGRDSALRQGCGTFAGEGPIAFNGLLYEEQYIEFSTQLPQCPVIYGLGERSDHLLLDANDKHYPMFNRDQGWAKYHANLYGTHPFYMELRNASGQTSAHGVFFMNSNAQVVQLQAGALTWRTIGGVLDLWFFVGSTPLDVIQQYTSIIGRPNMPPYWHLGFNQCRWGYQSIQETASDTFNYQRLNIPLDTQWNDIDIFDEYRDFTTDPSRYPVDQVRAFTEYLHNNGQHYINIIDPGIQVYPNMGYEPYDKGMDMDIFIKSGNGTSYELGKVWPGYCYFPDFSHPNCSEYWTSQLRAFRNINGPNFDGIWIDMNEISSFCDGDCDGERPQDPLNQPPYNPLTRPLSINTVSMTARTWLGVEYNAHSLYSFYEAYVTHNALQELTGKRPVVLTRSSFSGSGKYTSTWLGDNVSSWVDMRLSIPGVLAMQMFGLPMAGADICGFNGNTDEEMCSRWTQLGSFYPFSRNHNSIHSIPQEPWSFNSSQHIDICRESLEVRYLLIPYFYTLFSEAHMFGAPVWQALSWQFPSDSNTWNIDEQFLVGDSILVSPVLDRGAASVTAYFPEALWYCFYSGAAMNVTTGSWLELDAPITRIPVHVRGGTIVPGQMPALTTTASRKLPFVLIVAPDSDGAAEGVVFIDDGESTNTFHDQLFTTVEFSLQSGTTLRSTVSNSGFDGASAMIVGQLKVLGWGHTPISAVTANGVETFANFWTEGDTLVISGLFLSIDTAFTVSWS